MDDSQKKSIGAVVRTLREAAGFTRPELVERTDGETAERVGVEMLAKVEQGKKAPSAKTLRKLAGALGLEPVELAGRAATWEAGLTAGLDPGVLRLAVSSAGALQFQEVITRVSSYKDFAPAGPEETRLELTQQIEAKLADLFTNGSDEDLKRAMRSLTTGEPS